jgi:large subunit ribosomal protein L23
MSKTMTLRPRVSEKAYGVSQLHNTYVFVVPGDANRLTVAQAVAAQFNVTVEDVNILNVKGKVKRTVRKGGRAITGKDTDIKKAYVTSLIEHIEYDPNRSAASTASYCSYQRSKRYDHYILPLRA